jgi:uncharacterized protein YggT (Ycf19 family)
MNPKYKSIIVKTISTIIFIVLFIVICMVFETTYPKSVTNQINSLIHNILWFGVK